uniref:Phytanoyl-CoA dioxygenase n=1 Tax=viral metagenome TaxID=1070528 RepID=A0A6C0C023_9ZZZZ
MEFIQHLETHGWCIIPDILSRSEIDEAKRLFYNWQKTIPEHDRLHSTIDPHGIYKHHEVGHQEHAWFIRTNPKLQNVYRQIWKTEDVVVSFDGSCYIPKSCKKKDNIWTHSDQSPTVNRLACYQGFVALTENKERTLVVYNKTHLIHHEYFTKKGNTSKANWQRIDKDDVEAAAHLKRILHIPAGALVLWDSRTFHQNQYGAPGSEERIVQYVCFMPKNVPENTTAMQAKRKKYFDTRRTTSHWPYPIKVNGLQPQTYGDQSKLIDYSKLTPPNLERFMCEIEKII